ncbi:hypothetical protein MTO96_007807 [Rhipicephalus appendiculatus]
MNLSTEDNRAATKPFRILRLFIQYEIAHISGRHNHHIKETHQESQEYGYLLYFALNKQKRNRAIVAVVALVRRFLRVTIPMFFMIMCMYLLPLIASGPNSKEFYDRFYAEVRRHWWHLIAQIYNWRGEDYEVSTMTHLWYLSVDFQLFVVAVAVIQTFRRDVVDTAAIYYQHPFYHAVCFFSGCMTFTFVEHYGKAKISKTIQALLWCIALSCGLCSMYVKFDWNFNGDRASETKRMMAAFIDRILWSISVAWFWFACTTGRGVFKVPLTIQACALQQSSGARKSGGSESFGHLREKRELVVASCLIPKFKLSWMPDSSMRDQASMNIRTELATVTQPARADVTTSSAPEDLFSFGLQTHPAETQDELSRYLLVPGDYPPVANEEL